MNSGRFAPGSRFGPYEIQRELGRGGQGVILEADNVYGTITALLTQPPPDPRSLKPDLSPAVAGVIQRALAKAPAERQRDPLAFVSALRAALQERPAPAAPSRGGAVPVAVAVGLAGLASLGLGGWLATRPDARVAAASSSTLPSEPQPHGERAPRDAPTRGQPHSPAQPRSGAEPRVRAGRELQLSTASFDPSRAVFGTQSRLELLFELERAQRVELRFYQEVFKFNGTGVAQVDVRLDGRRLRTLTCLFQLNRELGVSLGELAAGEHRVELTIPRSTSMLGVWQAWLVEEGE